MFSRKCVVLFFLIVGLTAGAQQTAEKFLLETKYLLYLPDGYDSDTSRKWPMVIFLHGAGEAGDDLNKVKKNGLPKLVESGKKYPFILVSPQAPPATGWQTEVLKPMLESLKKRLRADPDRIYLTGLSMGGFGTWNLAEKYPDDFAAIAPICGGGDSSQVWKLRYTPVWCFHGAKDNDVLPRASQEMVDALRRYSSNVKFTLYPDANHNSWDTTYNNDSLYIWLLAQKRYRFAEKTLNPSLLQSYTGDYINAKKDTVRIQYKEGKIFVLPPNESFEVKASAENRFFWDPNSTQEIVFNKNNKGKVVGFTAFGNSRDEFFKVRGKK
ncbi:prolyl oligopeptidase family serine peptidase [Pollutibacter soli]|uniref:carboxylesterase family protein n=1 Tax=Pollutibacter soli TaxID=3034157 RepID=UPI0030133F20